MLNANRLKLRSAPVGRFSCASSATAAQVRLHCATVIDVVRENVGSLLNDGLRKRMLYDEFQLYKKNPSEAPSPSTNFAKPCTSLV